MNADTTTATRQLTISGTGLLLDEKPYCLQGLSFFNALFNPDFNADRGK